jgi:streptomycin 6-kinase
MNPIAHYLDAWRLTPDGEPFETPSSHICYVRCGNTLAVLKLFKPHADEARSAAALTMLGGPCVRVLESDSAAVLLERCSPGTPLSSLVDLGKDEAATDILCDLIAQIHRSPVALDGWPRLEEWGKAFARIRLHRHSDLTPALIDRAETAFYELCASHESPRLLHGDIHHENILQHGGDWRVIDPKGVVGDRAYEVVTALHNPIGHENLYADPQVMMRRTETFAKRLDLNIARILRWTFAQSMLSAAWHLEDGDADTQIATSVRVALTAERLLTA